MKSENSFNIYHYINVLTDILYNLGISVEYGTDFAEFRSIPKRQPARHPVNPAFNPAYCGLNDENAFWLIGRNSEREIVHTQAVKLLDLNGDCLENHLRHHIWDFRSHGYQFDKGKTRFFLSPDASRIRGNITYHGEVWTKPGRGGYRGGSLVVLLTRLLLLKAIHKWSPDFLIGLQAPATSCRGLSIREGYMRAEQQTILWHDTAEGSPPQEDWLVWMSKEDALFNLRISPEYFYQMFKKNTEPDYPFETKMSA